MSIFGKTLAQLRRPRLLIEAARHGPTGYDRETVVPRLLGAAGSSPGHDAFDGLERKERACKEAHRRGDAGYSAAGHVEVLTALIAEARLLLGRQRLS